MLNSTFSSEISAGLGGSGVEVGGSAVAVGIGEDVGEDIGQKDCYCRFG